MVKVLSFLLICFFPVLIPAQPISLSDAWKLGLRQNLSLQQQEKLLRKMEKEINIRQADRLPEIALQSSYNYTSELAVLELPFTMPGITLPEIEAGVKNRYDIALTATQPIFTGFRLSNILESARAGHQAFVWQQQVAENQLLLQIGLLYYQIQLNRLNRQVLQQGIERAEIHLQRARELYQAEQATAYDTLEVANRRLDLRNRLQQLRHLENVLLLRFKHLLNTDEDISVLPISGIESDMRMREKEAYFQEALANRPELQQISSARQAQSYQTRAVRSAYFPQVYLNASYHYGRPGVNFFRDEWMDYYTVGIGFQWNIWNWRQNQNRVAQARLETERLSLQEMQLLKDVQQQVTEAYQQLQNSVDNIVLQKKLVSQEQERYRMVRRQYEQGVATSLDLSDAEKALISAELQLQQYFIEWHRYQLQLAFATGKIGENEKQEIK